MMRPEESEPVCIVNGCGRSTLHRIGECAPDDAPTYAGNAPDLGDEVRAAVTAAANERADTAFLVGVAYARADERERIAQAIEAVDPIEWALAGQNAGVDAARIARGADL